MTRRFVGIIIEFDDDAALTNFEHLRLADDAIDAVRESVYLENDESVHVHGKVYPVDPHPNAPYIHPMTVRRLTLRGPAAWCDGTPKERT